MKDDNSFSINKIDLNSRSSRLDYSDIGTNEHTKGTGRGKKRQGGLSLLLILIFSCLTLLTFKAVSSGIDKSLSNQDKMLCESALVSGNREYLTKCECYYETDDIKCLSR